MGNSVRTVIGKDVIESLTIGMYDDSRFIFREYIQNAADQIDKARQEGLVDEGEIHIIIDPEKKIISVEDDATGIEENKVVEILKNIAQSTKQRGIDKGFRGIGRLGGLGYCNKLVFETSFLGEPSKSIMTWDALKLHSIINNRNQKEEASDVIDTVTSLEKTKEKLESHYFKVTLHGVTNNELLNVKEIRNYLSIVAPVPFPNKFIFKSKIYEELKKDNLVIDEYKLFINQEQQFKNYGTRIWDIKGKYSEIDEIIDVEFLKYKSNKGEWVYWGWYGIRKTFEGILKECNDNRGIRLRKSNIQIGSEITLNKFHREEYRGNNYFIGEIHAINSNLLPNARRDHFLENDMYFIFADKLKEYFHQNLYYLYQNASKARSEIKKIESYNDLKSQFEKKKEEGFVDKNEKKLILETLEKKKEEAIKAKIKLEAIKSKSVDNSDPIARMIERSASMTSSLGTIGEVSGEEDNLKPVFRTDKLSKLTKEQRKFLGNIFSVIKNVLPKETAELLILKIEEEYK